MEGGWAAFAAVETHKRETRTRIRQNLTMKTSCIINVESFSQVPGEAVLRRE